MEAEPKTRQDYYRALDDLVAAVRRTADAIDQPQVVINMLGKTTTRTHPDQRRFYAWLVYELEALTKSVEGMEPS